MIHPTLRCPVHKFAYVSMPRNVEPLDDVEALDDALDVDDLDALDLDEDVEDSWLWKCPLVLCLHGVRRPVSTIIREHDNREHDNPDKDGNPSPSPTGESL
jgi:hypothetical protein